MQVVAAESVAGSPVAAQAELAQAIKSEVVAEGRHESGLMEPGQQEPAPESEPRLAAAGSEQIIVEFTVRGLQCRLIVVFEEVLVDKQRKYLAATTLGLL